MESGDNRQASGCAQLRDTDLQCKNVSYVPFNHEAFRICENSEVLCLRPF